MIGRQTLNQPEPKIKIITSGDGWLVVEKPSGISIHNDPGYDLRSLLAFQVDRDEYWKKVIKFDSQYGFNAVGRLDKEADGVVLMAWLPETFACLASLYAEHQIEKTYTVLLQGRLKPSQSPDSIIQWRWSLAKGAGGRRNPAGKKPRVRCFTTVEVRETTANFTLAVCRPQTGRKHQIRRHAALAGHPLAGDRRYGSSRAADQLSRHYNFRRIALHASTLTFRAPVSNRVVHVTSSGMPPAFEELLKVDG